MKKSPTDYDIGYRKPPDSGKFGHRPQPQPQSRRSKKPQTPDIGALLNEHAPVIRDGKQIRLHPHEVMMLSVGKRALKKEIRAIKLFLKECKKAGLLDPPPGKKSSGVVVCPKWMPMDMFLLVGEPPWKAKEYDRIAAQFADSLKVRDEWFPGAREKAEREYKFK